MTTPVETVAPHASLFEIVNTFQRKAFRRLPVVDESGGLLGQISRRNVLQVIESMEDNTFLFGVEDHTLSPGESPGVDSAMRRARQQ